MINCDPSGNFTFDEPIKGQHRLLYLSFTKILNSYPEYLFVFTNEDSNKSIIGNNYFTASFFIKNNINNYDNNIYTYKSDDNYDQIAKFNDNVKNIKWEIFDIDGTKYQINDLKMIIEKIKN